MKHDNGSKGTILILFLIISLFAANAFILNSDLNIDFQPRVLKSIINNGRTENTFRNNELLNVPNNADIDDIDQDESEYEDGEDPNEKSSDLDETVGGIDEDGIEAVASPASGKVLIESTSKRILFGENAHVKCYPASTTKILTALVALKNLPLDEVVTVPQEAEGVEGSSIYLRAGQNITVEDLLYGLMLRSGNDAAVALALQTAGSVEAFAALMNETASALGAHDSHFVNPHGLHDDEHYTTPYDLALICAEAYELDDFKRIVGTKVKKITIDDEEVAIANKNKLLKLYDGANGVKTGFTKKSGRCLVGGAKREDMQLISVVLNCPDMWNETEKLLDYGFDNYKMTKLDHALLTTLSTEGKKEVCVTAPYSVTADWKDIYYPLRRDEYLTVRAA